MLAVGAWLFLQIPLMAVAPGPSNSPATRSAGGDEDSGWADWRFNEPKSPNKNADGRRLLVASAIVGGVGLTLNTARAAWFAGACMGRDAPSPAGCFEVPGYDVVGTVTLGVPALVLNLTSTGLAARGGYLRGSAGPRIPSATATRHIAWGSVMLGLGVAAQITSALLVLSALRVDYQEVSDGAPFRRRYLGASFGAQAGATLTAAGSGLLFHGLRQRKRATDVEVAFGATGFSLRF